ncbi:F5/8 type C domain protein [Striga asiatica]|uniref:F5/8 type C domain protein n=1 Tax=Striga asiatica TaxID=4170 RepID=A0A5A7P990_STRAF|nr:F5/8 type C domain protein [Striga asiatica]
MQVMKNFNSPMTFFRPSYFIYAKSSFKGCVDHILVNHGSCNSICDPTPYFPRLHCTHVRFSIWKHPVCCPHPPVFHLQHIEVLPVHLPRLFIPKPEIILTPFVPNNPRQPGRRLECSHPQPPTVSAHSRNRPRIIRLVRKSLILDHPIPIPIKLFHISHGHINRRPHGPREPQTPSGSHVPVNLKHKLGIKILPPIRVMQIVEVDLEPRVPHANVVWHGPECFAWGRRAILEEGRRGRVVHEDCGSKVALYGEFEFRE